MQQPVVSPKIIICADGDRAASLFTPWQLDYLKHKMLRVGLLPANIQFITPNMLAQFSHDTIVVGLGEKVLRALTDKKGLDKWHLSPLQTNSGHKMLATFDMNQVQRQPELGFYQELTFRRANEGFLSFFHKHEERFILNPGVEEVLARLDSLLNVPEFAVDIETGYGMINTIGFAWSPSDAIAINTLPDRCSDITYVELWRKIAAVLEGPSDKIFQNFIYDCSFLSAYGVRVQNIAFDTMWGQRLLYPEFDCDLGNIGRMWTKRTYWKDDGKQLDENGKALTWGNIRDWTTHYRYNCKDTTATLEASLEQRAELTNRGLSGLYKDTLRPLKPIVLEMIANGVPIDQQRCVNLEAELKLKEQSLAKLFAEQTGGANANSPKQVKAFLAKNKIKIPKKYDSATKKYKESVGAESLAKLIYKHPGMSALKTLSDIKELGKKISLIPYSANDKFNYSLNACATDTLAWSSSKNVLSRGGDIIKITEDKDISSVFINKETHSFINISLAGTGENFIERGNQPHLAQVKSQLWQKRMLSAPSGWHKYFYGRITDKLIAEAAQWLPEHMTVWLLNQLTINLAQWRNETGASFDLLYQNNTSLTLSAPNENVKIIVTYAQNVVLPFNDKIIRQIKYGNRLDQLKEFAS